MTQNTYTEDDDISSIAPAAEAPEEQGEQSNDTDFQSSDNAQEPEQDTQDAEENEEPQADDVKSVPGYDPVDLNSINDPKVRGEVQKRLDYLYRQAKTAKDATVAVDVINRRYDELSGAYEEAISRLQRLEASKTQNELIATRDALAGKIQEAYDNLDHVQVAKLNTKLMQVQGQLDQVETEANKPIPQRQKPEQKQPEPYDSKDEEYIVQLARGEIDGRERPWLDRKNPALYNKALEVTGRIFAEHMNKTGKPPSVYYMMAEVDRAFISTPQKPSSPQGISGRTNGNLPRSASASKLTDREVNSLRRFGIAEGKYANRAAVLRQSVVSVDDI